MNRFKDWRKNGALHLMIFPALALLLVYSYYPMLGIVIAFQKYSGNKGFFRSPWVGLEHFRYIFNLPDFSSAFVNTLIIAVLKILGHLIVPIVIALLLNEVRKSFVKRSVQTLIYFPHFLSWVILAGILKEVLSPSEGIVNHVLAFFGLDPIFFLGDNRWFRFTLVVSDVWKEFGFNTIIYLAALTGINPTLYEAAVMDGATRWKQTLHVTLPGIVPIIVLLATLSLGNVLNAGFDQVFNLGSSATYETGDILDTLIYRIGIGDAQYSVSTAIGLFKSVIGMFLISISYWTAYRFANYRIF